MRFNYVRYDEMSTQQQEKAKTMCEEMEKFISELGHSRPTSLALTALEETYMWIGKAIRDNQIARGSQIEHIAERTSE